MFGRILEQNVGRVIDLHLSSGRVFTGTLVRWNEHTVLLSGGSYLDKTEIQVLQSAVVAVEADV